MAGVNKVILVGRLGKDPELKVLNGDKKVASFSLATTEIYKDGSGERREVTEWHNISAWNGLADVCSKYLSKGSLVYVEGKLRTRSWEKEGVTKYATDVVIETMNMLQVTPREQVVAS